MAKGKDISMRQLRYFVAAADAGQFSQAALKVHVSQSAITAAVLQLEETLGVSLFERLPYGVALTAEGHKFAQHARLLDTLQDALSEPLFLSHGMQGEVRVGASYTVLGYFLPALLARFKRSYPQVEIDLVDMGRESIEAAVAEGRLDLGLTIISNSPDLSRFEHHVLIRSRRQLWLASQHPLMAQTSVSLEDVARHAYILATVDEGEVSTSRYWESRELTPEVAFRTSSMEALRGAGGARFRRHHSVGYALSCLVAGGQEDRGASPGGCHSPHGAWPDLASRGRSAATRPGVPAVPAHGLRLMMCVRAGACSARSRWPAAGVDHLPPRPGQSERPPGRHG